MVSLMEGVYVDRNGDGEVTERTYTSIISPPLT